MSISEVKQILAVLRALGFIALALVIVVPYIAYLYSIR